MHHFSGTTAFYNEKKRKLHNKKFTNTILITARNYQKIKKVLNNTKDVLNRCIIINAN